MKHKTLADGFLRSLAAHPDRPALEIGDHAWTYRELGARAMDFAGTVARDHATASLVAVWGDRSVECFVAILGTLLSGRGYVALPPGHGDEKLARMLRAVGLPPVAAGRHGRQRLEETFAFAEERITFVDTMASAASGAAAPFPAPLPTGAAYVAFTSGSTGEPKAVAVSHGNVTAYLDAVDRTYAPRETDRFSQTFDLGFDLSVHDMFVCWGAGASLCVVPETTPAEVAHFARERKLTFWLSLPSLAAAMAREKCLLAGAFPSLRVSLFCGEPLSAELASLWREAARESIVENLYGPTETTIAVTHHRLGGAEKPGIVPIGVPFAGHEARIVDGELYLAGPQVTAGYLNDERKTRARFERLPGSEHTWYRTGDLVRDAEGILHFLGRRDTQVKVRGHRVELEEIEQALRESVGTLQAAVVPWRVLSGNADAVIGFVVMRQAVKSRRGEQLPERFWKEGCSSRLPLAVVPRVIFMVPSFPLCTNGKLDRAKIAALAALLMADTEDAA